MFPSTSTPCRRHRVAFALTLVLAGALGLLFAASAAAQHTEPVSIYVTAEQGDKIISGLNHGNFRLFEDGQPKEFRLETPEKPVSIALLMEYSRSSGMYFNDIQASIQGFMRAVPTGEWMALATFSKDLEVRVDFTKDRGELEDSFASLGQPKWSEVSTYDAVYEMLEKMSHLKGRRVLILIGSGMNTLSKHTLDDVKKKIQSTNVTVYGIGAGSLLRGKYERHLSTSGRMGLMQAEAFMRMLADESGGEAWFPKFEAAFANVMKGVMQSIEHQYRLVYTSQASADGKFHKIKVEAFRVVNDKRENFKVRARTGWRF